MRVLALLLLLLVGIDARAADKGEAYTSCQALLPSKNTDAFCSSSHSGTDHVVSANCEIRSGSTSSSGWVDLRVQCANFAGGLYPKDTPGSWPYNSSCLLRGPHGPASFPTTSDPATIIEGCDNGCKYVDNDSTTTYSEVDGVYWISMNGWIPEDAVCTTTTEPTTPPPDADGDGISDENDAFPNDPNESLDTDGDGIGDNADFAPNDPNDGKDGEGDEDGDDEGDNVASGGGDCNAPPTCSGDGIQCAQLHTQWKIMCKGARVTGTPEVCESSYTCEGDAAQCAQVALLRKTACDGAIVGNDAAQQILQGLQGGPADNGSLNPMSIWHEDDSGDIEADDAGYGLLRTCPPGIQALGRTFEMPCDLGAIIAAIVLLAGFVQFGYAFTRD